MYNIPYYKAKDHQEVVDFMHANPFVTICGVDKEGFPVATQVPVLLKIEADVKVKIEFFILFFFICLISNVFKSLRCLK